MQKKNFIRSLGFAGKGLRYFFKQELHAMYHSIAAIAVVAAGSIFDVSRTDWAILIIAIALVFTSEIINTTIEKFMDLLHPQHHPKAGLVKDLAAGMVLFCSFIAIILGIIVFYPYIF